MPSKFVVKTIGEHRYGVFKVDEYFDMRDLLGFLNDLCQWCKDRFGNEYLTWNYMNSSISFNPADCVDTPNPKDELIFKLTWCNNVQTISCSG